ncbi:hypothetical protein [Colidextribacter sp. OB.20]|uniref:hypothetical protein n=1 Tax=Colidextribacter sp. OB.20 TaxID=2304568 RepID=UPI00136C1B07|nr:hypothetical protein [Colidextribacter sp. OB.20]
MSHFTMKPPLNQDKIQMPAELGPGRENIRDCSQKVHPGVMILPYSYSMIRPCQVNEMYLLSLSFTTHKAGGPGDCRGRLPPVESCRVFRREGSLQKVHVEVMKSPYLSFKMTL